MAPQLPVRSLGQQGLRVSAQGLGNLTGISAVTTTYFADNFVTDPCYDLGCMGMSMAYKDMSSPVTDEESIATIHKALDLGVTFLDTSDVYGPFTNEELVGKRACKQSIKALSLLSHASTTWSASAHQNVYREGYQRQPRTLCDCHQVRYHTPGRWHHHHRWLSQACTRCL